MSSSSVIYCQLKCAIFLVSSNKLPLPYSGVAVDFQLYKMLISGINSGQLIVVGHCVFLVQIIAVRHWPETVTNLWRASMKMHTLYKCVIQNIDHLSILSLIPSSNLTFFKKLKTLKIIYFGSPLSSHICPPQCIGHAFRSTYSFNAICQLSSDGISISSWIDEERNGVIELNAIRAISGARMIKILRSTSG